MNAQGFLVITSNVEHAWYVHKGFSLLNQKAKSKVTAISTRDASH